MLDAPPKTKFNVTQTFALFSSVLLWSKNRSWVAGNRGERQDSQDPADHQAHDAREALRGKMIVAGSSISADRRAVRQGLHAGLLRRQGSWRRHRNGGP